MKKKQFLKRAVRFFIPLLIAAYVTVSCTVLQWRATDTEIQETFQKFQIPTRISYYEVDSLDLKIRVQHVALAKDAINLVFFHGSPSSLSAWNSYLKDSILIRKAQLHAIDRPGYGYSNFGDEMTSIKLQAQLMSALINDYNFENVIAIGSSYGGPLAAQLAFLNKNVKGVVLISPAIDPEQEKKIWGAKLTQWWLTRWMVPTTYRVAGDEKTVHAEELALLDHDWELVDVPVIHIHGNADDIVPYGNVHYTAKKFKSIEVITIPDTGHEIAWARSELIMPHILELIKKVDSLR